MRLPSVTHTVGALGAAALTLTLSGCVTFEETTPGTTHSPTSWVDGPGSAPSATTRPSTSPSSSSSSPSTSAPLPDAATLVSNAQETLKATKRLTYRQQLTDKGKTVTVTTRGSVNGEPVEQTRQDPTEGTVTYRRVGAQLFINGDAKNWSGDTYALQHFVGHWVRALPGKTAQHVIEGMSMQSDIKDLLDDDGFMAPYLSSTATVKRDALPGVGDTYRVTGDDGSYVWITADARPRIVRLSGYSFEDGSKGVDWLSGYDDTYADLTTPTNVVQMPNDYDADGDSSPSSSPNTEHATT